MKNIFYVVVVALLLAACSTSGVRYSPREIKSFPPEIQEHIKNAEVTLGMSPLAVRYAWGAPAEVNILEPDSQGRFREEWVYRKLRFMKTRLIFTDGKLTGIISTEPGISKSKKKESKKQTSEKTSSE
jgi:hypothetical protein